MTTAGPSTRWPCRKKYRVIFAASRANGSRVEVPCEVNAASRKSALLKVRRSMVKAYPSAVQTEAWIDESFTENDSLSTVEELNRPGGYFNPAYLEKLMRSRARARKYERERGTHPITAPSCSWKPEVCVSGEWSSNGLRFATRAEAEASGREYYRDAINASRWYVPTDSRATESSDPVNYRFENGSNVSL
jgi:hypothetical protein